MKSSDKAGIFDNPSMHGSTQPNSNFFKIARELRDEIYALAFAEPKPSQPVQDGLLLSHPPYLESAKPDLLWTCKRIYAEARLIWWTTGQHIFLLDDPLHSTTASQERLAIVLAKMEQAYPTKKLAKVSFIGQKGETIVRPDEMPLSRFLLSPYFSPVMISVVVRHVDWPGWTAGEHLRISGSLPRSCIFPASTQQVSLQLETLISKAGQVSEIANAIKCNWAVSLVNGTKLTAQRTPIVTQRWQGSSTWDGQRWARDESEPELIRYIIAVITFKHEPELIEAGPVTNEDLCQTVEHWATQSMGPVLKTAELEAANVPRFTDGYIAYKMIKEYRERHLRPPRVEKASWLSWIWS